MATPQRTKGPDSLRPQSTPVHKHMGLASRPPRSSPQNYMRGQCSVAQAVSGPKFREVLSAQQRLKMDVSDDRQFYGLPRFVKHVDDTFLRQLTELYRQRIPAGAVVLDLMSSWVSHLPADVTYSRVIGHGLNAAELARNPQLSEFFVRNLNEDPDGWALADKSVDAVVCCVSVQYMQQPERVFAEILRALKPGGICIMAFSNRMFYTKAIQAWRDNTNYGRVQLVRQYFQCVEGFTATEVINKVELPQGGASQGFFAAITGLLGQGSSDPFCAVLAYRNFKPVSQ